MSKSVENCERQLAKIEAMVDGGDPTVSILDAIYELEKGLKELKSERDELESKAIVLTVALELYATRDKIMGAGNNSLAAVTLNACAIKGTEEQRASLLLALGKNP